MTPGERTVKKCEQSLVELVFGMEAWLGESRRILLDLRQGMGLLRGEREEMESEAASARGN